MMQAAKAGKLAALYVVGSNPVVDYNFDPAALQNTFVVVQELFLTETAMLAEVVLPAASAYEKGGTFTNTCGDLQLLKKAGDITASKAILKLSCAWQSGLARKSASWCLSVVASGRTWGRPAARSPVKPTAIPYG